MKNGHWKWMLALGACGCMAQVDPDGEESDVHRAPAVILDEDWDVPSAFQHDPDHRVAAQFAPAAALIVHGNRGVCSATLYDSMHVVTASHCTPFLDFDATFVFGRFAHSATFAALRLNELGLGAAQALTTLGPQLFEFQCTAIRKYEPFGEDVDVAVWRCRPNEVSGLGKVHPGDLWGNVGLQIGEMETGDATYALSLNVFKDEQTSDARQWTRDARVLVSPGEVTQGDDAFFCGGGSCYGAGFEMNNDTEPGSSGGAVVDRNTNKIFGVWSGWTNTNFGQYLPRQQTLPTLRWISALPAPRPSFTPWVGSSDTGRGVHLRCPKNFIGAGVVGTSYALRQEDAPVGNFGIVCVPFRVERSQAYRPRHAWQVLVGGSIGTKLLADADNYNDYLNEVLDLTSDSGGAEPYLFQRQAALMCPPGQFLQGINAREDGFVQRIDSIECGSVSTFTVRRPELEKIGRGSGLLRRLHCDPTVERGPTGGFVAQRRAVSGILIRSGWLTDGFALECADFDVRPL